ncbi:heme/hemin ABC transporter substrate-binding protein [Ottowia testudinis]|uniref:ABC transporter substrate-binding protein n=1 Tax=Ottowia testudinis TaxID=2816950 RepID=A0A975CEL2_9BURK|nr:ABC transporter substrate-binding protein [Ottowia testudinis]QTD44346.1 ABC transporter substrate-binding protein [Ottowia testudinis]
MRKLNHVGLHRRACLRAAAALAASCTPLAWGADKAAKRRIVSIGGALTEIAYALGAGSELAGVDSTSLYPAAATRLPGVGYARALSSEGILALAPTLVVATEEAGPPSVIRQIQAAGVPIEVLAAHHRFEGMLSRVTRMGELLGRRLDAQQLTQRLQADWQAARQPVLARKEEGPQVLFVLSHSPNQVMVGGKGTAAEAMLVQAGARNAVQAFSGFKPLTPEAVVAVQPDAVLFTQQGLEAIGGIEGALKLPGLLQTPAGQKRRIVAHEALFLLGFGPRMPQALAALDASLQQVMRTKA